MAGKPRTETRRGTEKRAKPEKSGRRLKVFRTATGFHDAYVAAPSRKAALAAWGTDKDLFARGVAEEVTDPELIAEPLREPGTVVRVLRTAPEGLAEAPVRSAKPKPERPLRRPGAKPLPPPPPPPPRRDPVDAAQRALDEAGEQFAQQEAELAARERELASERRTLEQRRDKELRRLARRRDEANEDYRARLALWREKTGGR